MKYSTNKDVDKMIRQLVREGWEFHWRAKHGRLVDPSGLQYLTVSKTPGDARSFKNLSRDVRRLLDKKFQF